MNILYLTTEPIYPVNTGSRTRSYNLINQLATKHNLTHAYMNHQSVDPDPQAQYRSHWLKLHHQFSQLSAQQKAAYLLKAASTGSFPMSEYFNDSQAVSQLQQLASQPFDVVIFQSSYILPIIKKIKPFFPQATFIMDAHNVESILQSRIANSSSLIMKPIKKAMARNLGRLETTAGQYIDGIAAVSDIEQQWWQQHCPGVKVALVANGVDTDFFKPGPADSQPSLVFCGSMSYRPNEEACLWFHQQVWPTLQQQQPQLKWYIVGKDPSPAISALADANIEVTGTVDDIRQWVTKSTLSIVPLLSGGGTRLKILDAMSMAKVVISTHLGAEGIIKSPGLILVDQPLQFAQTILDHLQSPQLEELGQQNRQLAIQHYSWPAIASHLETLLPTK